jgi:hypothetical protein
MLLLKIIRPTRDTCRRCQSPEPGRGFVVEDSAGVKQAICVGHLGRLLVAMSKAEAKGPEPFRAVSQTTD